MINALHLIWIIPLSGAVGYMWAAVFTVSARANKAAERINRRGNDE